MTISPTGPKIAVVIPCFNVAAHILDVVAAIGDGVERIYVVDDRCPEGSGELVESVSGDPRVTVIYHDENLGVGGATLTGYRHAIADKMDIIVKLDGDGQMDPSLIPVFVAPVVQHLADYAKGNRFYDIDSIRPIPALRRIGNAALSFMSKLSSGYWRIFDPTNGYTAIDARVLAVMPLDKMNKRYFFESDMLFRLGVLGAVVTDIPMPAIYGEERSNLSILRSIPEFFFRHTQNLLKRVVYDYFLRDFSIASVELVAGLVFLTFGTIFGAVRWIESISGGVAATAGTVMIAALPVFLGTQLLLSFLNYDMQRLGSVPLHIRLAQPPRQDSATSDA
ncbi:MAG: glycosyltransferase family 2 protein [Acidimicrobiia bacterium]|nr:glycosyltransferase family 2 protein [Acidimicrobiia bacterium]